MLHNMPTTGRSLSVCQQSFYCQFNMLRWCRRCHEKLLWLAVWRKQENYVNDINMSIWLFRAGRYNINDNYRNIIFLNKMKSLINFRYNVYAFIWTAPHGPLNSSAQSSSAQLTRADAFILQKKRSHSFQWRAGDFRRQARQLDTPLVTGWGVSSDATKIRILQLYANEERHSRQGKFIYKAHFIHSVYSKCFTLN